MPTSLRCFAKARGQRADVAQHARAMNESHQCVSRVPAQTAAAWSTGPCGAGSTASAGSLARFDQAPLLCLAVCRHPQQALLCRPALPGASEGACHSPHRPEFTVRGHVQCQQRVGIRFHGGNQHACRPHLIETRGVEQGVVKVEHQEQLLVAQHPLRALLPARQHMPA